MKTISIMEAQHNLAAWVREVEAGHELAITRRKQTVARLVPPAAVVKVAFPDFKARARNTWSTGWKGAGADALLDETRGAQ
ncbi:MAG: type II toxin-antitoxin system Phd/YefM family antitoxin [Chthoniobacterales bacterium]